MCRKTVERSVLLRVTDTDHRSVMDDVMRRICHPTDRSGHVVKSMELTAEQGVEVWEVMVSAVLVPYFAARDDFFRPIYVGHPEKRIWWMRNFFKRYSAGYIRRAREVWKRRRIDIEAAAAADAVEQQRRRRPRCEWEWEDDDGVRWYKTPQGTIQQIPSDAPTRPSDCSTFNYIIRQWQEIQH